MLPALVRATPGQISGNPERQGTDNDSGSEGRADPDFVTWVRPKIAATITSLDDVSVTATPAILPALAAGPSGIMVTAHGDNTVRVRVSGVTGSPPAAEVAAGHGQQLAASASYVFSVANASGLSVVVESGSSAKVCVSAV